MPRNQTEFDRLRAIETDDCVIWPYGTNGARGRSTYGQVSYNGKRHLTHRLALALAIGEQPGMDAAHGPCHENLCMNVRHLSWKSRADNLADTHRDGTATCGENHRLAKLTDEAVRDIRSSDASTADLAATYGVSFAAVHHVRIGQTWRHVI